MIEWAPRDPDEFPVVWVGDFVEHVRDGRNVMTFYEVLNTTAPRDALPYCCLINNVVFYEQPYRVIEDGARKGTYARYDEIETQWNLFGYRIFQKEEKSYFCAPLVWCEGEWWLLAGGTVLWRNERWEMERHAYRNHRECEDAARWFGMHYEQVKREIAQRREREKREGEIMCLKIALGEALPFLIAAQKSGAVCIDADKQRLIWNAATEPLGAELSADYPKTVTVELGEYRRLNRVMDAARRWKRAQTDREGNTQLKGPRNRGPRQRAAEELFEVMRGEGA